MIHSDGPTRVGDWFQTFSGVQFYPFDPRPEDIRIEDIAHHLSMICRFGGAIRTFYSVGQHSVLVSHAVPEEFALWGLLHDASEAYLGDMVRPLKVGMPAYRDVEHRVMSVIAERFGLSWPEPPEIKIADNNLLATERRDLLPHQLRWTESGTPLANPITPWSSDGAELVFLQRFKGLYTGT